MSTHDYSSLATDLHTDPIPAETAAKVRRLLATQPDADMLADALGVGQ